MSFSFEQKQDIMKMQMKSFCCRMAFLHGVMSARAVCRDGLIEISLESRELCEHIAPFVKEFFGRAPVIASSSVGGRRRILSFESAAAEKYLTEQAMGGEMFSERCPFCNPAFLRGLFFAAGSVSSPEKQYSLEFSLGDRARRFSEYLETLSLYPKRNERGREVVLYFRNSTMIEDFFALAGMNHAVFHLMNTKINSDIRNGANRVANCETNNIMKAVNTSMKQIEVIEALENAQLLSSLPEDLVATARLRLEHRDLSLSQLAALATPHISKSGLSHRLAKIMELGKRLLGERE